MTRIYLTSPFDDDGIRVVSTLSPPQGDILTFEENGITWRAVDWYFEDATWHRTKKAAIKAAAAFRADRITKAAATIAHLSALPPPTAPEPEP